MKYLLIQPPGNFIRKTDGETGAKLAVPPLGLLYIASHLRRFGHEVQILDCQVENFKHEEHVRTFREHKIIKYGLSNEEIYRKIDDFQPDIVGISCLQCTRSPEAHTVAAITKTVDEHITTVIGGQYGTSLYTEALKDPNVDYCCVGEGEYPMLSLSDIEEIPYRGLSYMNASNNIIVFPKANIIESLDYHKPAWDLIDLKKYANINLSPNRKTKNKNFAIMITSRGCTHSCEYCPTRNIFGQKWRFRTPDDIIEEIMMLQEKYRIQEIQFEDSDLLASKKRMLELCNNLKYLDISWCSPHGMAVQKLDEELLDAMAKSGCYALHLSVEFGTESVLERVKPTVNLKHTKNIVKHAKNLGMDVTIFTMIGHPTETRSMIQNTIDYTTSLEPSAPYFFCIQPMPATPFYDYCKTNDFIVPDFQWSNLRYSIQNLKVKGLEIGELEQIRRDAWLDYMGKGRSDYDFWRFEET